MFSIIIPIRYRKDLTQVCLDSINLYTKDYELILVQEGENEEITKYLNFFKEDNPNIPVKVIQNPIPKGYAGALNAGLAVAKGDYYVFMNNDTVVTPNWLDEMLKAFDDPEVGLVSPTFWGTGDRQSVDWNNGQQFDNVLNPFSIIGVCYLVKKEVMDKVGNWDEQFIHGGEDFDLTIRISNAGYKLIIARQSFIYHYGGASTRIVFDNDLEKVQANRVEKFKQLEAKYNLDLKKYYGG